MVINWNQQNRINTKTFALNKHNIQRKETCYSIVRSL